MKNIFLGLAVIMSTGSFAGSNICPKNLKFNLSDLKEISIDQNYGEEVMFGPKANYIRKEMNTEQSSLLAAGEVQGSVVLDFETDRLCHYKNASNSDRNFKANIIKDEKSMTLYLDRSLITRVHDISIVDGQVSHNQDELEDILFRGQMCEMFDCVEAEMRLIKTGNILFY